MASVFLSYDHDDANRAASVAAALEKAGHSVWWDRHIHGGAEYNSEIESAVERAHAVVVLWSKRSVRSAWVRDEAAEGRDQGKLIPVRLDSVKPPMGFRQFQTIDLTAWTGKRRSSAAAELLRAIEALGKPVPNPAMPPPGAHAPVPRTSPLLLTGVVAVLLTALALLWWRPWPSAESVRLVTVLAGDDHAASRSLAQNLLVQLGSLQSTNLDTLVLVESDTGADADLVFKAAAVAGSSEPRASLSLVDTRSDTLLWSREFVQPGGNPSDLRQQLAYSAGQVLRCTTEALAPDHPSLSLPVLRLYLKGCADLSASSDPQMAIPAFQSVTQEAPQFANGWGKLLIAKLEVFKAAGASHRALQADLRRHVVEAKKINPNLAEAYLVQSWLQPARPILNWMRFADEALRKNPDNAEILENHAIGLGHFGRMRDAIESARRAVRSEPLSSGLRQTLIAFLMDSGSFHAAKRELNEAERLWPGASNILETRFLLEYRYGDPKKALDLLEEGRLNIIPTPLQTSFLRARIDKSPSKIEMAVADARKSYEQNGSLHQFIQTLAAFGRKEDAINVLLSNDPRRSPGVISVFFRPHLKGVRSDPRFMTIAQRYGLVEYWNATGRWPDFCSEQNLPYDCREEAAKLVP